MNTPPALHLARLAAISPSCSSVSCDAWRNSGVGSAARRRSGPVHEEQHVARRTRCRDATLRMTASMHPRLSVSAVSSWRWTLDEDLAFWAEAGIDHVGLSFRKLEEAGLDAAVARVRDAGLRVSNIVELGWWDLDAPSTWPAQQERLARGGRASRRRSAAASCSRPDRPARWSGTTAADALADALEPVRARRRGERRARHRSSTPGRCASTSAS